MSKRKPKTSKQRLRFGDSDPKPKEKKRVFFPGLPGDDDVKRAAATSRLCTAVLQGHPTTIPGGKTKADAAAWCTANMKGSPFPDKMSNAVAPVCTKPNGKPMAAEDCQRAILRQAGKLAVGVKLKLNRVVSPGAPLVRETVYGKPLIPTTQYPKAMCRPAGKSKKMRDCHYELEFFNEENATKRGLPSPGTYLRLCPSVAGAKGALFSVSSPEEAKRIMDKHCECRKSGKNAEQCEAAFPSKPAGFGKAQNRFKLFGYGKKR